MAIRMGHSTGLPSLGNVSGAERWGSLLAGLGLTLLAARSRGGIRRAAASAVGLSLLSRAATGYCGMKAAVNGEATLGSGMREQWQRVRGVLGRGAAAIDSLESLYVAELQELHSAAAQLAELIGGVAEVIQHAAIRSPLQGYATELRSRREDLGRILGSQGFDPRKHPDQAMQSLINETRKMSHVCGANVRDAALVASVQRIIHYQIASYGTVASYAKTLGRLDEAGRFAEYADRDEVVDAELSGLAKSTLNPQASTQPQGQPGHESRPH